MLKNLVRKFMGKHETAERELAQVADAAAELYADYVATGVNEAVRDVTEICDRLHNSWSGSNLGYHANVYFNGLEPIAPGAHFSPEWGIKDNYFGTGSDSRFVEYAPQNIKNYIMSQSGNPDFTLIESGYSKVDKTLPVLIRDTTSILTALKMDSFLEELLAEMKAISVLSFQSARTALYPRGQKMSRDSLAITQGTRLAPHQEIWADMLAFGSARASIEEFMTLSRQAGAHLSRTSTSEHPSNGSKRVFIGHGRSPLWRELKDFLKDTLRLEIEEFSQVPTAGISTTSRLFDMLDQCGFALLVMSAEDETPSGKMNARLNVVHEIGLFQGRLGPNKAIVVLEENCEEFSNIHGLGQIRFPVGDISARFEQIRAVLKREGIIEQ